MATPTLFPSLTTSIPLTTVFTPSPSCLSDYYYVTTPPAFFYISLGPPATSACLPPGWNSTSQYFSPGICPSGYTNACSTTINIGAITETRATCCPTGYHCQTNFYNVWMSTDACTLDAITQSAVLNITRLDGPTTTIFPGSSFGLNAYGVSVRWQQSDFITTSPSSASGTSTATMHPFPPVKPTSNHLSSGAKAGIGVGVMIFFLISMSLFAFLLVRYRRMRTTRAGPGGMEPHEVHEVGAQEEMQELPATRSNKFGGKTVGVALAGGGNEAVQIRELRGGEHAS